MVTDLRYSTSRRASKLAVAGFYAAYFGVLGVVLPFLGPYLSARNVSAIGIGLVMAAFSLSRVFYTPLVAMAADRGRWLPAMLSVHLGVAIVATAMVGLDLGVPGLVVAFFLVGLGFGTVLPLVEASVLEQIEGESYGRSRLWGSVGFIAVALLAGLLMGGQRILRMPFALGVVLVVLLIASLPLERSARPAFAKGSQPERLPWIVWALLAVLTLNQVAHGPYYAFLSVHLSEAGVSRLDLSWVWSVAVIAELGAFLLGPRLQRRWRLSILLGFALLTTPLRWLLLALPVAVPVVVVAQLGHAMSFALAHLAGIQLVQLEAPPNSARFAQALYSGLCFGVGIVVGSVSSGPLYDRCGGRGTFLAAACLSVAVFGLWIPISRQLSRKSRS